MNKNKQINLFLMLSATTASIFWWITTIIIISNEAPGELIIILILVSSILTIIGLWFNYLSNIDFNTPKNTSTVIRTVREELDLQKKRIADQDAAIKKCFDDLKFLKKVKK